MDRETLACTICGKMPCANAKQQIKQQVSFGEGLECQSQLDAADRVLAKLQPTWQDRPDKAGEYWITRVSKISGKRIKPHHITVHQDYIDGDFDGFIGAKWLYIPEPELPKMEEPHG